MKRNEIKRKLKEIDKETFLDRCAKIEFLNSVLGEDFYYFHPEFAVYYFEEAKRCYIYSQFIASILMCQLVCTEMLKQPYRNRGNIALVNQYGFKDLINLAESDKFISKEISYKLHEMRKFRNLLEHTKDYTNKEMILLPIRIKTELEDYARGYMILTITIMELLGGLP
jgi:hypothetical protein